MSGKGNSEGTIIAWGLLVLALCFAGSVSTDTTIVEFFFLGVSGLFLLSALGMVIAVAIAAFVYAFRRPEHETRSLWQIISEDYNPKVIVDVYKFLYSAIIDYLEEYEWYRRLSAQIKESRGQADDRLERVRAGIEARTGLFKKKQKSRRAGMMIHKSLLDRNLLMNEEQGEADEDSRKPEDRRSGSSKL